MPRHKQRTCSRSICVFYDPPVTRTAVFIQYLGPSGRGFRQARVNARFQISKKALKLTGGNQN